MFEEPWGKNAKKPLGALKMAYTVNNNNNDLK